MCGRFVSATPPDELARYFGADAPLETLLEPNYNVAPSATVFAVRERRVTKDNKDTKDTKDTVAPVRRTVDELRWGLIPFWAKEAKIGNKMFNARSETLDSKPAFKRTFGSRRCIVPVTGFYEWAKPSKQPVFIQRADGDPLALAGLWESWRGPDRDQEPLHSCTIITGKPNAKVAEFHDRMPVVLPPTAWQDWLDPSFDDTAALAELFTPCPSELLRIHPVRKDVNNSRSSGAQLIEAYDPDEPEAQGTLL